MRDPNAHISRYDDMSEMYDPDDGADLNYAFLNRHEPDWCDKCDSPIINDECEGECE